VITLAFSTDPMARWTFPDPATYLRVWPQVARAFGGNGFAHGAAHLGAGEAAAAMWLPPGVHSESERLTALIEEHTPSEQQADLERVFAHMETHHPSEPCWYLPLIAVDPSCQGRGYGSALLRYALEQCDRDVAVDLRVAATWFDSNEPCRPCGFASTATTGGTSAMPPNQRVRFHDGEGGSPVNEASQNDERDPCGIVGSTRSDTTFRVQSQLLTKEQILGRQLGT
jgi:GNAT superfamily N-acetyltransferase